MDNRWRSRRRCSGRKPAARIAAQQRCCTIPPRSRPSSRRSLKQRRSGRGFIISRERRTDRWRNRPWPRCSRQDNCPLKRGCGRKAKRIGARRTRSPASNSRLLRFLQRFHRSCHRNRSAHPAAWARSQGVRLAGQRSSGQRVPRRVLFPQWIHPRAPRQFRRRSRGRVSNPPARVLAAVAAVGSQDFPEGRC